MKRELYEKMLAEEEKKHKTLSMKMEVYTNKWKKLIQNEFFSGENQVYYLVSLTPDFKNLLLEMKLISFSKMNISTIANVSRYELRVTYRFHSDINFQFVIEYIPENQYVIFTKSETIPVNCTNEDLHCLSQLFLLYGLDRKVEEYAEAQASLRKRVTKAMELMYKSAENENSDYNNKK